MAQKLQWKVGLVLSGLITPLLLLLSCAKQSPLASEEEPILVLQGGTLIDGTGSAPRRDVEVLVRGNRIAAVGLKGSLKYPGSARVISTDEKFILPGLIDSHAHYSDWAPELFLFYGVTTAKDMGNITRWIIAQRQGINAGKIIGPRIFATGNIINKKPIPGGPGLSFTTGVDTPEEAREATRQHIQEGVDLIKVYTGVTPEILGAIAEEAHARNLPVSGHIGISAAEAARRGVDVLEHASGVVLATAPAEEVAKAASRGVRNFAYLMDPRQYDSLIRILLEHNVYLTPTLVVYGSGLNPHIEEYRKADLEFLNNPNARYVPRRKVEGNYAVLDAYPPEEVQRLKTGYQKLQAFLLRFKRAGGKILAGTDSGSQYIEGRAVHRELQLLVDSGLTPLEAIQGATGYAAQALRKEQLLGTVEPGKLADLLVLNADPLADITNTPKIDLVIKDGRIVDRKLHADFTNPLPAPFPTYFGGPLEPAVKDLMQLDAIGGLLRPRMPYLAVYEDDAYSLPVIEAVSPEQATEGGQPQAIRLTGRNFTAQSQVLFGGTKLGSEFVSSSELRATIPSAMLSQMGRFSITVDNPGSGGGVSNNQFFLVTYP